jgi:superoxide reductase
LNKLNYKDMATKFYRCPHCGNVIQKVVDKKVPVVCCGQKMQELVPGTVDASVEKHTPAVTVEENLVKVAVGSVAHPMAEEHFIQWIYLQTKAGGQRKALKPGDAPEAVFALADDEAVAVYEYCNLHGLWKKEL